MVNVIAYAEAALNVLGYVESTSTTIETACAMAFVDRWWLVRRGRKILDYG